jgi:hypothetical protein
MSTATAVLGLQRYALRLGGIAAVSVEIGPDGSVRRQA